MNKVFFTGRLTADPVTKEINDKNTVSKFTIAVDRYTKPGEEKQTDFINIVAWNKTGFVNTISKGRNITVIGKLQNRTWNDDSGNKKYITEVVVEEFHYADSKPDSKGTTAPEGEQKGLPY